MFALILTGTFLLMEGVAWATHKYVMHGFLWSWHKDHHLPEEGFFEKNDLFLLIFAVPGCLFFCLGGAVANSYLVAGWNRNSGIWDNLFFSS